MDTSANQEQAVELLQQLGLKEYEAACFVGLTRVSSGTAKDLSEITEVPRTRVYDAIRVLEAQGLVEIQHSSPQRYRAVPLEEAIETLRGQFEERIDVLSDSLSELEDASVEEDSVAHEVWAMSGSEAIANRTQQLLGEAEEEVVLVVGEETLLTDELVAALDDLADDVDLYVGAVTESLRELITEEIPDANVFVSGLNWLEHTTDAGDDTEVGRLLLVDRSTILVSSYKPASGVERAVFGRGFGNGLVVIARRLMATGLVTEDEPPRI